MKKFDYETLRDIINTEQGKTYISEVKKVYSYEHEGKPILSLPFSAYERFWKDGNRREYEVAYFYRRNRLFLLQELALTDSKYLPELEDTIAALCDEYTWVLPAHGVSVDLFSADTGANIAETAYIFKDKLSKHLLQRIENSLERQILIPYESQKSGWESGNTNNWGAVCASGVGLTYMYMFPTRFEKVKERLFDTFNSYIEHGLDDDGYCSEGICYWQYGFGEFCEFFAAYVRLYGERPDFIDCSKLKKTLAYTKNAQMESEVYIPFADGGRKRLKLNVQPCLWVKGLYGDEFDIPPYKLNLNNNYLSGGLSCIYYLELLDKETDEIVRETSVYYEKAQVFIRKRKNYAFAAKCGNNDEFHNHNDVGAFQIVKDEKRYICDVGCGEYTKDYFSNGRYEYFVCNANSHSIPIVDGRIQREGRQYCGRVVSVDDNSICMDLSAAYADFDGRLFATYTTKENGVEVLYSGDGVLSNITYRFVGDIQPVIKKDGVYIDDMRITCEQALEPTVSVEEYSSHTGEKDVAYIIEFVAKKSGEINAKFRFEFENVK